MMDQNSSSSLVTIETKRTRGVINGKYAPSKPAETYQAMQKVESKKRLQERSRSDALIISKTSKLTYVEILRKVKMDTP